MELPLLSYSATWLYSKEPRIEIEISKVGAYDGVGDWYWTIFEDSVHIITATVVSRGKAEVSALAYVKAGMNLPMKGV